MHSVPLPVATVAPPSPPVVPPRRARQRAVAVAVGVGVAALVVTVRVGDVLHGPPALVLALVLTLAAPTSRHLSRRVVYAASLLFGLVPVLWWWDVPWGAVGRAGTLLAVGAGALATTTLWEGTGGAPRRVRALVPRFCAGDVVVLGAVTATVWVTSSWLRVSTGAAALGALVPGWDNSAHFDMVQMLRRYGVTVDQLPLAPFGEHWKFVEYPQGYHAVVATVVELMASPGLGSPDAELVAYVHAEALVLVAAAGMVAAGLCALPRLRHSPLVALPLTAFPVAALVTGPGGTAFTSGFPNFVVASTLTACIPLVATRMPRVMMPLQLAVIGSMLVGVAHTWVLLLVVALPAAALGLVPAHRSRWRATRSQQVASALVVLATVGGLAHVLGILSALDPGKVLVTPGAITTPDAGLFLAVTLGSAALCLLAGSRTRWSPIGWTAAVPAAGLLAACSLALLQRSQGGELSYYFWKLVAGVELVGVVVLAMAAATLLPRFTRPTTRRQAASGVAASVLVTVAVTQVFGFTGPGRGVFVTAPELEGTTQTLLDAASASDGDGRRLMTLLPSQATAAMHPVNAQQWFLALTGRWTVEANDATTALVGADGLSVDPATALRAALELGDDSWVLVNPAEEQAMRATVTEPSLADRILTW